MNTLLFSNFSLKLLILSLSLSSNPFSFITEANWVEFKELGTILGHIAELSGESDNIDRKSLHLVVLEHRYDVVLTIGVCIGNIVELEAPLLFSQHVVGVMAGHQVLRGLDTELLAHIGNKRIFLELGKSIVQQAIESKFVAANLLLCKVGIELLSCQGIIERLEILINGISLLLEDLSAHGTSADLIDHHLAEVANQD